MAQGSYEASGSILPFSFVKFDTTTGNTGKVLQAGAGDRPIGIAQCQQDQPPLSGLQSCYAAVAGENVAVYDEAHPELQTLLRVDAAYAQGTFLKPGTNGIGTVVTGTTDIFGCRTMVASFAANDVIAVLPTVGSGIGS